MTQPHPFTPYGPAHLTVIFLTIALPFILASLVRRSRPRRAEGLVDLLLSLLLIANYVVYLIFVRRHGMVEWQQMLPLQLCDWGMVVVIVAMWSESRRWFEVAYFWGLGGTLQAILTPNLFYGFPDLRFVSFFVSHSGIIIGVIFIMLIHRYRPYPISIVRVFLWSELYFVVTLVGAGLTGYNYGFLLHKPEAFTILSFLSDSRPVYLLEMHGLALAFFLRVYAPFAIYDWIREDL